MCFTLGCCNQDPVHICSRIDNWKSCLKKRRRNILIFDPWWWWFCHFPNLPQIDWQSALVSLSWCYHWQQYTEPVSIFLDLIVSFPEISFFHFCIQNSCNQTVYDSRRKTFGCVPPPPPNNLLIWQTVTGEPRLVARGFKGNNSQTPVSAHLLRPDTPPGWISTEILVRW